MLQRAASNAYSWWWASHIRTKQSRWLEENLQDLEEKVRETLKIIDNDGDSFRERAEMYYKKRPELINFVEEAFRAYRALAERYDLLSRQLQTANRTIATVFPEHAQYAMDDDDDDEENLPGTSTDPNKPIIPKVPKIPEKDFRSQSMLISRKKGPFKRAVSSAKAASGMSKSEALQEIDKLQKETLALQTEKEFVQSLYERVNEKYWEIENKITDTQKRVCGLEDEFGIEIGIDDDEARTLMAATALKSCEQTLVKLQEKQEESAEDARVEHQRIKDVNEKFATIKNEFVSKQTDGVELKNMEQERHDVELERENVVEEQVDVNSRSSLSVMELAEKIDDLVKMVVTLETAASSETALVETLRSETDELQEHIQRLEGDKENLVESSENMGNKLKELEEELRRVKILNTSLEDKNNNLQTHFTEANNLSGKLQGVEQDKEDEDTGLFQDVIKAVPDAEPENGSEEDREKIAEKEEKKDDDILLMPEKPQEPLQQERDEKQDSSETVDSNLDVVAEELEEEEEEEDQPIWKKMFVKGLEDREKIILDEYTSVLGNNKLLRKKLSEVEKKNKDSNFELEVQIRELKSAAASKDEMIQSLLQKLSCPQPSTNTTPEYKYVNQESISQTAAITEASNILLPSNSDRKTLSELFGDESTEVIGESPGNSKRSLAKQRNIKVNQVDHHHAASSNEEKFRSDIDDLLEENLEFWLRFSTSVHEIQKFQTSVQDLHAELQKAKDKKQEGSGKNQSSKSDLKPIYRHLREIQTEVSLWLEHNAVLKEDLLSRLSSLCSIQENLSRMSKADYAEEKTALTAYQAGKFQGEILNMKQENSKVSNELQAGLNRVTALKVDVERTLEQLDEELGITASKKYLRSQPRIPLRSFLFGVKVKKQKPSIPSIPSFFPCANPALQKQYSDLAGLHV